MAAKREPSSYVPSFARGLSVLVVDEDRSSLDALASMLESLAFKVTGSVTAVNAIEMIAQKSDRFKLVLASTTLADIQCPAFLRYLLIKNIPLVVVFPELDVRNAIKFLLKGAMLCLHKPLSLEDLKYIWQHSFRKRNERRLFRILNAPPLPAAAAVSKPPPPPSQAAAATRRKAPVSRPKNAKGIVIGKVAPEGPKIDLKDKGKKKELVVEKTRKYRREDGWVHHELRRRREALAQEETKLPRILESYYSNNGSSGDPRTGMDWNQELEFKFLNIMSILRNNTTFVKEAQPNAILDLMDEPNLTLDQVASRLQEYRSRNASGSSAPSQDNPSHQQISLDLYQFGNGGNMNGSQVQVPDQRIPILCNSGTQNAAAPGYRNTVSQATALGRKPGLGHGTPYASLFRSGYRNTGQGGSVGILEALFTEKEHLQPNHMMFPRNSAYGNPNAYAFDSGYNNGGLSGSFGPYFSGQYGFVPNAATLPSTSAHLSQSYPTNYSAGYENTVPDMSFGENRGAATSAAGGKYDPRSVHNALMFPTSATDVNVDTSPAFTGGNTGILPPMMPLDHAEDFDAAVEKFQSGGNAQIAPHSPNILPPLSPAQADDIAAAVEKLQPGEPQNTHFSVEAASPEMKRNYFSDLISGYQDTVLEQSQGQVHSTSLTDDPFLPTDSNSMDQSLAAVEVASPGENLTSRVSNLTVDSPAPFEDDGFLLRLDDLVNDYEPMSGLYSPPHPQSPTNTQLEPPQWNVLQFQSDASPNYDDELPLVNLGDQVNDDDHEPTLDPPPVVVVSSDSSEDEDDEDPFYPEEFSELLGRIAERINPYL